MTHTGTFDFSFAAAVAAADLDAEIAAYKAEQARPNFIVYSRIRGGFVYGDNSAIYESNTAADIARSAPIPTPTPMPGPGDFDESDSALCANCSGPAHEWCAECRIDICMGCNERWHRHGQPASRGRNGAAFFDRQRAAAAFRKSTIETYLDRARAAATELHGDIGDAAYSVLVQDQADALFS